MRYTSDIDDFFGCLTANPDVKEIIPKVAKCLATPFRPKGSETTTSIQLQEILDKYNNLAKPDWTGWTGHLYVAPRDLIYADGRGWTSSRRNDEPIEGATITFNRFRQLDKQNPYAAWFSHRSLELTRDGRIKTTPSDRTTWITDSKSLTDDIMAATGHQGLALAKLNYSKDAFRAMKLESKIKQLEAQI